MPFWRLAMIFIFCKTLYVIVAIRDEHRISLSRHLGSNMCLLYNPIYDIYLLNELHVLIEYSLQIMKFEFGIRLKIPNKKETLFRQKGSIF